MRNLAGSASLSILVPGRERRHGNSPPPSLPETIGLFSHLREKGVDVSYFIESRKSFAVGRRAREAGQRAWRKVRGASTCRECGERILPWASVCHRCGAGSPFKVAVSPQLLFTAIACEIVLVILSLGLN
jgi:hypothetical protein